MTPDGILAINSMSMCESLDVTDDGRVHSTIAQPYFIIITVLHDLI